MISVITLMTFSILGVLHDTYHHCGCATCSCCTGKKQADEVGKHFEGDNPLGVVRVDTGLLGLFRISQDFLDLTLIEFDFHDFLILVDK